MITFASRRYRSQLRHPPPPAGAGSCACACRSAHSCCSINVIRFRSSCALRLRRRVSAALEAVSARYGVTEAAVGRTEGRLRPAGLSRGVPSRPEPSRALCGGAGTESPNSNPNPDPDPNPNPHPSPTCPDSTFEVHAAAPRTRPTVSRRSAGSPPGALVRPPPPPPPSSSSPFAACSG